MLTNKMKDGTIRNVPHNNKNEERRAHLIVNKKPLKKTNSGSYLYYHKKQINELKLKL